MQKTFTVVVERTQSQEVKVQASSVAQAKRLAPMLAHYAAWETQPIRRVRAVKQVVKGGA